MFQQIINRNNHLEYKRRTWPRIVSFYYNAIANTFIKKLSNHAISDKI